MRLLCQVTPSAPGLAPWVLPSLCQMMTAAEFEPRQPVTVFAGDAVPVAVAVKLLVVPAALPRG